MSNIRKNLMAQINRRARSFEKRKYDYGSVSVAVAKALQKLDVLPEVARSDADFSIELDLILGELSRELKTMDKGVKVIARWYDEENVKIVKDLRIVGICVKWTSDMENSGIQREEFFTIDRLFLEGLIS